MTEPTLSDGEKKAVLTRLHRALKKEIDEGNPRAGRAYIRCAIYAVAGAVIARAIQLGSSEVEARQRGDDCAKRFMAMFDDWMDEIVSSRN